MARPSSSSSTSRRSSRRSILTTVATLTTLALQTSNVAAQALFEPPGKQVMFGAWIQTEEGDFPLHFNSRLGQNASVLQISQPIPLPAYNWTTGAGGPAPENLIEWSGTDAAVFLTVYPSQGFDVLTVDDYTALGNQLLNYTENFNRSCFLRWAPEMNGNWNAYGIQPLRYVQVWQEMYAVVKSIAPQVAMVWAPNTGQGYPYSMTLPTNQTEAQAMDTNNDGQLTYLDDPFEPYYPGDEYIDWIGLSVYYKGVNSQNFNVPQGSGYCYGAMQNYNPNTGTSNPSPWYDTYCTAKPDKACMFAESGAAYHTNPTAPGSSELALKQAWWQDCLTNASFFEEFPRLKLMMQFEYEKDEFDGGILDHRDYRLANNTEVLDGFVSDLASVSDYYTWANYREVPTKVPGIATVTSVFTTTDADGSVVTATSRVATSTFSFVTVRVTNTGFPSLFGNYQSSAMKAVVVSVAMFATSMGVMVGGTMFLMRL